MKYEKGKLKYSQRSRRTTSISLYEWMQWCLKFCQKINGKLVNLIPLSRSYGQRGDSMFNILMHHSWNESVKKKYGSYIFWVSILTSF